ncbi:tape measure protein [Lactococcus garvieae]|uniref:tape measure protein n=1 Tax=Lactococcus garvieae TaxID=1363 RepID=UPI001F610377|nr:tape measure protein [Lactococcus garvieae]MCI3860135.1 tape measure protein [Lactococcus garvieae]
MGAKLSTTLSLVDGFSSKLNSVNNSLQKTSGAMDKFRNSVNKPIGGGLFSSINGGLASANSSISGFSTSAAAKLGAVSGVVQSMTTKAIGAVTTSIEGGINRFDTLNNSALVFKNMGVDADVARKSMDKLKDSVEGLPTALDSAVANTQLLTASMDGDMSKSVDVYRAMNDAILGFGGSAAQVDNAVVQLSQSFSNGKVDAQTWNSMINSGMGPVLNALAKQMGVTTGELKSGLSEGKISVDEFQKSLIELDKNGGGGIASLQQIVKDGTKGIRTNIDNTKNALNKMGVKFLEAIGGDRINKVFEKLRDGIGTLGDTLAPGFKVMADKFFQYMPQMEKGISTAASFMMKAFGTAKASLNDFIGGFKSTGAVDSLKRTFDSLQAALGNIKSNLPDRSEFFTQLGELAGKGIEVVADNISKVADAVAKLSPEQLDKAGNALMTLGKAFLVFKGVSIASGIFAPIISGVGSIIGAIGTAIGAIGTFIGWVSSGMVSLGITSSGVFAQIGTAVGFATWPLLALIAVVSLVAFAIISNFGQVRDFLVSAFGAMWDSLKAGFENLMNALQPLLDILGPVLSQTLQVLGGIIMGTVVVALYVFAIALVVVVDAIVAVITVVSSLLQMLTGLGTALVSLFKGDFKGAADAAKSGFESAGDSWKNFADNAGTPKMLDSLGDIIKGGDQAKGSLDGANSSAAALSGTLGGIESPKIEPQFTAPDTSKLGSMNLPDIPVGAKVDKVDTTTVSQSPLLPDLSVKAKVDQVDASPLTSGGVAGLNSLMNNPIPVSAKVDKVDTAAVAQTSAVPDIAVGAKVNKVDTTAVANAGAGIQPLTMPAKVGQVDTSSLAVGSPAMAALQSNPAVIPTKAGTPDTSAATTAIANIGTNAQPIQTPPVSAPDTSAATSAITNLQTTAQNSVQPISNAGTQAGQGFVNGFQSSIGQAVSVAQNMGSQITGALNGVAGQMYGIGVNIGQGLANGMNASLGAVTAAASALAAQADKAARAKAEVHSPSRVFMATGQFFGQGLAIGMQKQYDNVATAGAGLFDSAYTGNNEAPSQTISNDSSRTSNNSNTSTSISFGDIVIQSTGDPQYDGEKIVEVIENYLVGKNNAGLVTP